MSQPERFEVLILGSGEGGKNMAWHMARSGRRTAVVERKWIGAKSTIVPVPQLAGPDFLVQVEAFAAIQ